MYKICISNVKKIINRLIKYFKVAVNQLTWFIKRVSSYGMSGKYSECMYRLNYCYVNAFDLMILFFIDSRMSTLLWGTENLYLSKYRQSCLGTLPHQVFIL